METLFNPVKPKIGIVGGAGPLAGAVLFEKIIQICQKSYACTRDKDFPFCLLLSYPFSEMLKAEKDENILKEELQECFNLFAKNGISIASIACNTLHAFLPLQFGNIHLVHMILETASYLKEKQWKKPLVLCTSTSAEVKLHTEAFSCRYLNSKNQKILDDFIDKITIGEGYQEASDFIHSLDEGEPILLGCTELSQLNEKIPLQIQYLCDPNTIVAEKICQLIFSADIK